MFCIIKHGPLYLIMSEEVLFLRHHLPPIVGCILNGCRLTAVVKDLISLTKIKPVILRGSDKVIFCFSSSCASFEMTYPMQKVTDDRERVFFFFSLVIALMLQQLPVTDGLMVREHLRVQTSTCNTAAWIDFIFASFPCPLVPAGVSVLQVWRLEAGGCT